MSSLAIQVNPYLLENNNSKTTNSLNPLAEYDPTAAIKTHTFWSTLHKIAAWVCIVGFAGIAAATIAITTLYWAVHVPIVTIVLLAVAMPTSFPAVKYFFDKSTFYKKEAEVDAKLITHLNPLLSNPLAVQSELKSLGIVQNSQADSKNLAFLLARYNYFKERQKEVTDLAMNIIPKNEMQVLVGNKVLTINPSNYNSVEKINFLKKEEASIFEIMLDRWVTKSKMLREAAASNLKAAYLMKLMENPYDQSDLPEFIELSYLAQLIAKDNGDKKADILVKTPKKNYTIQELLTIDTRRLAREIFGLQSRSLFG